MLTAPPYYRQSIIATFDSCALRALFAMTDRRRTPSEFAAVGTLFHRWKHLTITEMRVHAERTMSVEQGLERLVDVIAQRDIPSDEVVPVTMRGMTRLRILVVKWCAGMELSIEQIVDTEIRLYSEITLDNGEAVRISGQLDTLFADPDGLTAGSIDAKTGYARPKQPRDEEAAKEDGRGMTELGWTQSVIYALLVFDNYPFIHRFWFREWHVFWGEAREVWITREQIERLRDVVSAQVSLLHQAVTEGEDSPRWIASAGPHCALCSRPRDCPIRDQVGIPADPNEARRLAQEWIVAGRIREERAPFLKGWVSEFGPIEVPHSRGRRMVGWDVKLDGKRTFGLFEPESADPSPFDELLERAARDAGVLAEESVL
jgi:hypothetical protein